MSRQQFSSSNGEVKIFSFQKSGATASFDPHVTFPSSKRVSWRLDNGSGTTQVAGNSLTYTGFTSDSSIRTIELRTNSLKDITELVMDSDNIYGHIDLTDSDNLWNLGGTINLSNNSNLTGITNPMMGIGSYGLSLSNYNLSNCGLTNELDLTPISGNISSFAVNNNSNLTGITFNPATIIAGPFQAQNCNLRENLNINFTGTSFQVSSNPNLTGITHSPSSGTIFSYQAQNCNLTGTLDLSMLTGLASIQIQGNPNLTKIIHTANTGSFSAYWAYSCNLTGNHDVSPLSGFSSFQVFSNPNLTSITHSYSTVNLSSYFAVSCNLTGNHDLTMFPNLGGYFNLGANNNLTGITHTASTQVFTNYIAYAGLVGNLDLSMLSGLGGRIELGNNINLTGITLPISTQILQGFEVPACNITGTLSLSGFSSLGSISSASTYTFKFHTNSNLSNILFPAGSGYLRNDSNNFFNAAMGLYSCNLGYVDFKPLSGCTLISGATQGIPRFELFSNTMTTADVNQVLSDFDLISTLNYSGWTATSGTTGGYINISSNSAPDGSSGGYNGTGATVNLVAKGWTVITD